MLSLKNLLHSFGRRPGTVGQFLPPRRATRAVKAFDVTAKAIPYSLLGRFKVRPLAEDIALFIDLGQDSGWDSKATAQVMFNIHKKGVVR